MHQKKNVMMKSYMYTIIIFLFYACKQVGGTEINTLLIQPQESNSKRVASNAQTNTYDFSSIKNDTLFVKGKIIVFTKPSEKEFQILKDEEGINKMNSDFDFYTSKVIDSLKSTYTIISTTKRIIGIINSRDTTYLDRLNPKAKFSQNPIHYSAILVFNDFFSIYPNLKTDIVYYSLIKEYFNNIRYEKPIEYKYVISRNGLNIRKSNGTVEGKFNNGDFVRVLGYTNKLVRIEDEEKTTKGRWAIIQWDDIAGMTSTTKKGYVLDEFLGKIEDVKVYEDQICIGSSLEINDRYNNDVELECLTKYFDFELISEQDYNSIKVISSDYLSNNPLVKVEENEDKTQNITLPVKDSSIVFKSELNYSSSSHNYLGDIDFLNQYLMYNVYFKAEDAFYTFIDRTSGKETFTFPDFPNISPDKKLIVIFNYDVYEEIPFLEIYHINDDKSINISRVFNFIHWLQIPQDEIKWLSNKEFVIPIVNKNIWNGSTVKQPQYLKMKIKE